MQKVPTLHPATLAEPYLFILPPNTAGQAKLERPRASAVAPAPPVSLPFIFPSAQLPPVPGPCTFQGQQSAPGMFFNLSLPSTSLPSSLPSTTPSPSTQMQESVPYTTQQYRKRKEEREHSGTVTRKYTKKTDVILCSKCSQERKPPSHLQYFGNWYCEKSETQTYSEWRAVLEQRGYGRKGARNDNPRGGAWRSG